MKNIIFLDSDNFKEKTHSLFEKSFELKQNFSQHSVYKIIDVLTSVRELWREGSFYYKKASCFLEDSTTFSKETNIVSLQALQGLLERESLESRVRTEFGGLDCLDGPSEREHYEGRVFYAPLGLVLHITAGNIFLGQIDSLIMGALTKNISLIKLSSHNTYLADLFFESLLEADKENVLTSYITLLHWIGGTSCIENHIKLKVDAIIAWGGDSMVKSYLKDLPPHIKFIQHGPKISFQVISKKYLDNVAVIESESFYENIVQDIITWNQSACASAQNIFLEEGININDFLERLNQSFKKAQITPNSISDDEYIELRKDENAGLYQEYLTGNKSYKGEGFQIQFDHEVLTPSALNISIKVKLYKDLGRLCKMLDKFSFYLQTCGLAVSAAERGSYFKGLSLCGVTRLTEVGKMLESLEGSPHDGQFSLVELTKICADELWDTNSYQSISSDIPIYERLDPTPTKLKDFPIIDSNFLTKHSIYHNDTSLLSPKATEGFVYASGGTNGAPKFSFYSYDEFWHISKMLGDSYKGLGLREGEHVANLFMPGNLWSSFNIVQMSLECCRVIQYPMGGQISPKDFLNYIRHFNIKVIFGLPGLLLNLANEFQDLKIEKIFYAGESFSKEGLEFIKKAWGNPKVYSAGYACVDVGPIAYQTPDCLDGEHFLFDKLIDLEVIDGEAVVSSKVRKMMPVIRYKTGDAVKVLSTENGKTKIKLLGRIDKKINIWSSRFEFSEVKNVLEELDYNENFQIQLMRVETDSKYTEKVKIIFKKTPVFKENIFIDKFYEQLKDVRDTHSRCFLNDKIIFETAKLTCHERTGKLLDIIDLRLG